MRQSLTILFLFCSL